jgi:hypothetical protein
MTGVEALQTTLAAEHAAVYVHGVLGGRTSQTAAPALFAAVSGAYAAHRARRDHLVAAVTEAGAAPVPAEPAYDVPADALGAARIAAVGLETEQACATTYAWLVAHTVDDERDWAIEALNETAVRELAFRGTPEMFPGADEHADR